MHRVLHRVLLHHPNIRLPLNPTLRALSYNTRGSRYEGRPLVEEFKRGINEAIRRKLMEAENLPGSIEQWFRRAMVLNRNWRESSVVATTRHKVQRSHNE